MKKPYKVIRALATDQERYEHNLKLVDAKSPDTARQFNDVVVTNIHLMKAASGRTTGAVWDVKQQSFVQIHSFEDPEKEAEVDANNIYTPSQKIFILIGAGLGYLAAELSKRLRPYQRMAIFERNPAMFKAAMYACDLEPILSDKRIDTFIGDTVALNMENWFLNFQSHEKFHIMPPVRSGYTASYDVEFYDNLTSKCVDMLRYHAVGLATWQQFGPHIGDNDIANIPEYFLSPGLNKLEGAWRDKPAICVAAGPSLKKNLKYLLDPELRKRVCVLAVGTVYGLLRSMGIIPDIVTSIDFQRLNWTDQFRLFPQDRRSALVYLHSVYPQIPRRWPGPQFVTRNSSDTTEWLQQFDEPKSGAGQVQTVAHLNVVAALAMGANPIVLIGQDLSMPPNEHHAPGAMAQDVTPEQNPDACVPAVDIYGNHIMTRHSFLSMRTVFAQMFQANPGTSFINCTEGGIHIENSVDMPLSDIVRTIKEGQNGKSESAIKRISEVYNDYTPTADFERFKSETSTVISAIDNLYNASLEVVKIDMSGFYNSDKRTEMVAVIKKLEDASASNQMAMAMICVRRFDIVSAMSEIEPNGDGVTELEILQYRMKRTIKTAQAIIDEYPILRNNLRVMLSRVNDITETLNAPVSQLSYEDIIRKLARQSYFSVARELRYKLQDMSESMYFNNDMEMYLKLISRLAFHLQEYSKCFHILDSHSMDSKTQDRCQKYIDKTQSTMIQYISKYLVSSDVPMRDVPSQETDLC